MLAFKLLIWSTQPFFAPSEPLRLEVACVSIPEIASAEWQERWSAACSDVELEIGIPRLFFAPHRVALVKSPGRFPFLSHPRRGGGGLIADLSVRLWVPPRSD